MVALVQREVILNPSHTDASLFAQWQSLSEQGGLADWFSVNIRGESEFRVTGGAEMRVTGVKAHVKDTYCQLFMHMPANVCVFGSRQDNRPTVNFKMPQVQLLLQLLLLYFLPFMLTLLFFFSCIILTDRGLKWKWRCSEMQGCHQNKRSPPSKSQTMPS